MSTVKWLAGCFAMLLMITGCAKQPSDEINAARTAVDSAVSEGAEKYAPEDAKRLNERLNDALAEVASQDKKLQKNYKKAKEMLAGVKSDAERIKAGLETKKEEAKARALSAQESAKSSLAGAKDLLSRTARSRRGTELEAVKADVELLEASMADVQKAIDGEDYPAAASKASSIRDKAESLSERIKNARG